jgi:hypothetical protein
MTTSAPRSLTQPALAALSAGTRVDQHLLTGLNVGLLDQRLPRGERDQWQGGGFGHVESLGLGGDVALVDGEVFGEGADAVLSGFGVHRVAGRESAHPRTGLNHDAGQVVAQHDRKLVGQKRFEFSVADLQIQRVDAGGVDLHQDVVVAQGGPGSFNGGDVVGLAVAVQRERFHRVAS